MRYLLLWTALAAGAILGAATHGLTDAAALWAIAAVLAMLLTIPAARAWLHV